MEIVVQKFGGTSVDSRSSQEKIAKIVIDQKNKGAFPVLVVSAMGRSGAPYATDTLRDLVTKTANEVPSRELDLIMSCGEIISCVVLSTLLNSMGVKAKAFSGGQSGIITDKNFGSANVIDFRSEMLLQSIENGIVPVVAGFQGITEDGEITTLGRGGSDITAVILGAGLRAERVEIYTDVDGIMTADPRILSEARMIEYITYEEVFQLSNEGAKVIHPKAVEIAMRYNIPVVIKNLNGSLPGTLITSFKDRDAIMSGYKKSKIITGIAHTMNVSQIVIKMSEEDKLLEEKIFRKLADEHISIDLINLFPDLKVFTVNKDCIGKSVAILKDFGVDYKVNEDCAKVSVVGVGMRGVPGVMAKIIEALYEEGIDILQTSDSHTTISVLIKKDLLAKAVSALHRKFELGKREEEVFG
ncbi:Aspartokinase [Koleobacter methoxysyntrophicus]|uniref:Aspartokinase n=1 Tax=Koleobacter methoxysyntrophicus TaxID=2751313 RepID=A0A8A0RPV2_9FIRM|nr:aspartate kinase [Koleobacter methoxysyntrophicus]QSQ09964.1 Aspartokinase [Koleobacter methoxysyntrophicus]